MSPIRRTAAATAALFLFILFSPVTLLQSLRECFLEKKPLFRGLSLLPEAYAEVLATVEEALETLIPEGSEIHSEVRTLTDQQMTAVNLAGDLTLHPVYDRNFRFYRGIRDGQVTGYAVEDAVPGKWGAIHYMVGIDADGAVTDAMVLEYSEKRGRPVARRRFLKQFFGKGADDEIRLMKDIRGVTGASISSQGMTNGIRKLVHVFRVFFGQNHEPIL